MFDSRQNVSVTFCTALNIQIAPHALSTTLVLLFNSRAYRTYW